MIAARDPFGFRRVCYLRDGDLRAPSVRAVLERSPGTSRALDLAMLRGHLDGRTFTDRTLFEAIGELPPGHALIARDGRLEAVAREVEPRAGDLEALLRRAVSNCLARSKRPAVALSGGLDSAIVAVLAGRDVPAYVLAPRMEGYSELDAAMRTAARTGVRVTVVDASAQDFAAALPDAIAAIEVPLYNAHPVGKLLLARAMRRDGIDLALSGDGADHVAKRDRSADYLPLARDLFASAGVELASPFLDNAVIAHLVASPPDREKPAVRAVGAALGVAPELHAGPKRGRLAPPLDLRGLLAPHALAALSARVARPLPRLDDDPTAMRWTTAALLLDAFGALF